MANKWKSRSFVAIPLRNFILICQKNDTFGEGKFGPEALIEPRFRNKEKTRHKDGFYGFGGEGGIRTLDTLLTYTHFPGVLLQPLGHLSKTEFMIVRDCRTEKSLRRWEAQG